MPDGGRVDISLRKIGDEVVIAVADQGAGIAPEDQDRIFDLYFSRKHEGSGIGLAIAFRVIHLHHGAIDVASEVGRGTTFSLRLPALTEVSV
jgi:signal transduction histidine kinase